MGRRDGLGARPGGPWQDYMEVILARLFRLRQHATPRVTTAHTFL